MAGSPQTEHAGVSASLTSHSQQSLHRLHFGQRWLAHASFVHQTQISVDGSPQMLQTNEMAPVIS
jgi:hypothetical protein